MTSPALANLRPGQKVPVQIVGSDGASRTIEVTPGELPGDHEVARGSGRPGRYLTGPMGTRAPGGNHLSPAPRLPRAGPPHRLLARLGWSVLLALVVSTGVWALLPGASLAPAVPNHALGGAPTPASTLSPGSGPGTEPRAVRATFPFPPPRGLRSPRPAEQLPSLYADGLWCSVGCRVAAALPGWPLRPFQEQHPLRAGINELRPDSLHVGVDIQAPDGAAVFAVEPGVALVLARSGPDARVRVGSFIYWHITPLVRTGQLVQAYSTALGTIMPTYGHLAFSELDVAGQYVNPLRPGGRVLAPWVDRAAPVIADPSLAADGTATVAAFDPQTVVRRTTYLTPVLAPAAIAYRLYDVAGTPVTPLRFAFRGTHLLPWLQRREIYAPGAHEPGFSCFATQPLCRPRWVFWLAGGLAPALPAGLAPGRYRLTVYAWDWADNRSALDTGVRMTARGWRPRGRVPPRPRRLLQRPLRLRVPALPRLPLGREPFAPTPSAAPLAPAVPTPTGWVRGERPRGTLLEPRIA